MARPAVKKKPTWIDYRYGYNEGFSRTTMFSIWHNDSLRCQSRLLTDDEVLGLISLTTDGQVTNPVGHRLVFLGLAQVLESDATRLVINARGRRLLKEFEAHIIDKLRAVLKNIPG